MHELKQKPETQKINLNKTYPEEVKNIENAKASNQLESSDLNDLDERCKFTNSGTSLLDQNEVEIKKDSEFESKNSLCAICHKTIDSKSLVELDCKHFFCNKCLCTYLKVYPKATCPHTFCKINISYTLISSLLSRQDYKKFLLDKSFCELVKNESLYWCPIPNCKGFDLRENSDELTCNKCSFKYCSKCSHAWHGNSDCDLKEARKLQKYMDAFNLNLCPRCKSIIDTTYAECLQVKCIKCTCIFCACCGSRSCIEDNSNFDMRLLDIFFSILLVPLVPL